MRDTREEGYYYVCVFTPIYYVISLWLHITREPIPNTIWLPSSALGVKKEMGVVVKVNLNLDGDI